ncbi:unnamed protein product [Adineta ricciae]|uniref:Uncharacterized protein n=1 Tax=Adineta ricciae TaxID=249248 RepID=A0A813UZ07_ADIRI|nr:unnamed protein product [Adineta ricciae]CAF1628784.1 unnamed protein product [Adineta ricciae]
MPPEFEQFHTEPHQTVQNQGKMTLGNLAFAIPTNPHPADTESILPRKPLNKIRTWKFWSIFNLIFLPFGLLCCYLSYQVHKFKNKNRYETANKWSKRAFVSNIITTLLMIGVIITVVMLRYDYHQQNSEIGSNQTLTTGPIIPWQPGR